MEHRLRLDEGDAALLRRLLEREMLQEHARLKKSGEMRAYASLYARLANPRRGQRMILVQLELGTKAAMKQWMRRLNRAPTPAELRAADQAAASLRSRL